jgi:hypothetical protein
VDTEYFIPPCVFRLFYEGIKLGRVERTWDHPVGISLRKLYGDQVGDLVRAFDAQPLISLRADPDGGLGTPR